MQQVLLVKNNLFPNFSLTLLSAFLWLYSLCFGFGFWLLFLDRGNVQIKVKGECVVQKETAAQVNLMLFN